MFRKAREVHVNIIRLNAIPYHIIPLPLSRQNNITTSTNTNRVKYNSTVTKLFDKSNDNISNEVMAKLDAADSAKVRAYLKLIRNTTAAITPSHTVDEDNQIQTTEKPIQTEIKNADKAIILKAKK